MHVQMYAHTHARTHMHTHTHKHTHTHGIIKLLLVQLFFNCMQMHAINVCIHAHTHTHPRTYAHTQLHYYSTFDVLSCLYHISLCTLYILKASKNTSTLLMLHSIRYSWLLSVSEKHIIFIPHHYSVTYSPTFILASLTKQLCVLDNTCILTNRNIFNQLLLSLTTNTHGQCTVYIRDHGRLPLVR